MSVTLFRIAQETLAWRAGDLSGAGAAHSGGRWNRPGLAAVYASESRALAALEVLVHLRAPPGLPLDRYLVEIAVPDAAWKNRTICTVETVPAWDAVPESGAAVAWGSAWLLSGKTLLAEVPSVVVPEEHNVLVNPQHAAIGEVRTIVVRKWRWEPRA